MKIALINTSIFWGGGEQWFFDATKGLIANGYDVILCLHPDGELKKRAEKYFIPTFEIELSNRSFLNPRKIKKLKNFFIENSIDTILLNQPAELKIIGIIVHQIKLKNIIYRRGSAIPIKNSIYNRYLLSKVITKIIANSEETKRTILLNLKGKIQEDNIYVIYNGIDLSKFAQNSMKVKKKLHIGTLGRLAYQKNHHSLINIAKILKDKNLNFKLLIGGEGKLETELKQQVSAFNLTNNVKFLGNIISPSDFYQQIDFFLLTSHWEGFGYVIVEALASGLPVICYDISSNKELIENGIEGFLVEYGNENAFAETIIEITNSSEMYQKMSEKALEKATMFSIEKMLNELINFLNKL